MLHKIQELKDHVDYLEQTLQTHEDNLQEWMTSTGQFAAHMLYYEMAIELMMGKEVLAILQTRSEGFLPRILDTQVWTDVGIQELLQRYRIHKSQEES
ncbi:MAG: hypothetical protein AAFQ83_25775 [Bacteroidota bacterium]